MERPGPERGMALHAVEMKRRIRDGDHLPLAAPDPGAPTSPPEVFYGCSAPGCSEERTWPADELWWWDAIEDRDESDGRPPGWYCHQCSIDRDIDFVEMAFLRGIRLDRWLKADMVNVARRIVERTGRARS